MAWTYTGSTVPPAAAASIGATADYAGRALAAAESVEGVVTSVEETRIAIAALAEGVTTDAEATALAAETVATQSDAAAASAAAAAASALTATTAQGLIQAAQAAIAVVSVPALPHVLDGLSPSVLFSAPSGAMVVGGAYAADPTSLFIFSSASKRVIGPTGTLDTVAVNQPAYDWSTGRRRLLIEAAGATNYLGYGQSPGATGWTVRGTAAVVTGVSDPAGGTTATRLTVGAIYTNDLYRPVTGGGASTRHEPSVFIRRVSTTGTILVQNTAGSGYGYWTVDMALLPDGWVRLTRSLAAVTVGQEFTTDASNGCGLWFASTGASSVTFETFAGQIEKGGASTSPILATGAEAVTRIADDVRLSTAALAQVTGAGGCTIVLRGSLVGADWIMGGAVNGAMIHAANGTIRSDSGEFIRPSGWASSLLANFGIALGCAPAQRKIAINGSPVATSGTNALWGVADETSIRFGADMGGSNAINLMLDELAIWPFAGSDAGIQSQARPWS